VPHLDVNGARLWVDTKEQEATYEAAVESGDLETAMAIDFAV
jgi:hypothetical protein